MSLAVFNSAAFLTDAQLAVAAGATVTVRRESDSGLASIFSDRAGTVGITNPSAFADASGRFTFYAAGLAGGYSVEVTSGAESFTLNNVAIGLAAELDASTYGGSLMNAANAAAARATLGSTATGDAVFIAASAAAARTLLDVYSQAEIDALLAALVPAGTMLDYAGGAAQTGFLLCDGSNVSRTTYATLYAAIGTTWGVGDGSTTFALPDSRRKTSVGSGGTGTGTLGNAVGNTGGAETHTIVASNLPTQFGQVKRNATPTSGTDTAGFAAASYDSNNTGPLSVFNSGGGQAMNILGPSMVVTKMIKT